MPFPVVVFAIPRGAATQRSVLRTLACRGGSTWSSTRRWNWFQGRLNRSGQHHFRKNPRSNRPRARMRSSRTVGVDDTQSCSNAAGGSFATRAACFSHSVAIELVLERQDVRALVDEDAQGHRCLFGSSRRPLEELERLQDVYAPASAQVHTLNQLFNGHQGLIEVPRQVGQKPVDRSPELRPRLDIHRVRGKHCPGTAWDEPRSRRTFGVHPLRTRCSRGTRRTPRQGHVGGVHPILLGGGAPPDGGAGLRSALPRLHGVDLQSEVLRSLPVSPPVFVHPSKDLVARRLARITCHTPLPTPPRTRRPAGLPRVSLACAGLVPSTPPARILLDPRAGRNWTSSSDRRRSHHFIRREHPRWLSSTVERLMT